MTTPGRLFCILFAIVGIPFTLSVIADMGQVSCDWLMYNTCSPLIGQIIATLMTAIWSKYKQRLLPYLQYLKPRRPRSKKSEAFSE